MQNFFGAFSNLLKPAQPKVPPDSVTEPAQITQSKVLLIVYDPVMDKTSGMTLSQQQSWYRTDNFNRFGNGCGCWFFNDQLYACSWLRRDVWIYCKSFTNCILSHRWW